MLILDRIIYFKPWKKGKVFIYQVLPHLPINWSKVLCAIDFYRKMKFLLGALISWQQLIHEYLISPYSEDKNLRSRLQKLVQVWIKCCMYFFMFKRDLLMIFVAFCTSVNWSYECQLSIWVKDYYFKMQSLKEYYFSDTCFHHIKLSDRKDLCWNFALKNKKKLFMLWSNISLRSFERMIIHIQSPSITALQTDTIYVWLYGLY